MARNGAIGVSRQADFPMARRRAARPCAWLLAGLLSLLPAIGHAQEDEQHMRLDELTGDAMEDIWFGLSGGTPSITALAGGGVSITLPTGVAGATDPASLARIAKKFLDRWAPGMCSHAFDFQSPHKHMRVAVRVLDANEQAAPGAPPLPAGPSVDVTIDYEPSRKVICVVPGPMTS